MGHESQGNIRFFAPDTSFIKDIPALSIAVGYPGIATGTMLTTPWTSTRGKTEMQKKTPEAIVTPHLICPNTRHRSSPRRP